MNKKIMLIVATLSSSAYVYLPFLGNFDTILRYYDGPLYVIVAQNFYHIQSNPFPLPEYYYSTHLIVYPLLIRIFSPIGFFNSMILVTLIFSVLSVLMFYYLLEEFNYVKNPFFIALLFIFLPPRWLIYHSVGASEPIFLFSLLLSLYMFKKERLMVCSLSAAFATATRIHGIVLFPAYAILALRRGLYRKIPLFLIIPTSLFLNFYLHYLAFGDLFSYFKWNAGLVAFNYPFSSILIYGEDHLFQYLIYALAGVILYRRRYLDLSIITFSLYLPLLFVVHPDLSRYLIPLSPFALIAFEDILDSKEFKLISPLLIMLIYFYVWSVIPTNLVPQEGFEKIKTFS
jgi:hypothetical protein